MKKFTLVTLALITFATLSFAAPFVPSPMIITGSSAIHHDFVPGTALDINFSTTKAGEGWLIIMTKGQGASIGEVLNGNLDYHYVNNIDTTIYVSEKMALASGANTISWPGTNDAGGNVPAGEYTYYLWAFDNISARVDVCKYINSSQLQDFTRCTMMDFFGPDQIPLNEPFIFQTPSYKKCMGNQGQDETHPDQDCPVRWFPGTVLKWVLGGDYADLSHMQTTWVQDAFTFPMSWGGMAYVNGGGCLDPNDPTYSKYYMTICDITNNLDTIIKQNFNIGALSTDTDDFDGGWDNIEIENHYYTSTAPCYSWDGHVFTDGNYLWKATNNDDVVDMEYCPWTCFELADASEVFTITLPHWYMPEYYLAENYVRPQLNPNQVDNIPGTNLWTYSAREICLQQMLDMTDTFVDEEAHIAWENKNGDLFLDRHYKDDDPLRWQCFANRRGDSGSLVDEENLNISAHVDSYGFVAYGLSAGAGNSFAVMTPDGQKVGYGTYGDDIWEEGRYWGKAANTLDGGTSYDGIYTAPPATIYAVGDWRRTDWVAYVAQGNFVGTITDQVIAVEDDAQAAFAVDPAYPNPANPTTTIGFTIPEAGNVTVNVFNVAGQKVDTLANGMMSVGKHSVVWDASGFSAGVYFYTVKSGDFSKTMKVTILK